MGFLDEVAEQGRALRDLVEFYRGEGDELLCRLGHISMHRPRSFVFTGMGTSEFVPEVIRSYLGGKSPTPVVSWEAGELLHHGMDTIRDDDVIFAVSQSGESVETRKVVELLSDHRNVIAVTNSPKSTMARLATLNLPILAGEEATISTKTYTNAVGVMLLLSRALAFEDWLPVLTRLEEAAAEIDDFHANRRDEIDRAAEFFRGAHTVYFVSRGPAMAAARQAALTFQEGCHVYAAALSGGSMRHGPFEIVGQGHYAVVFAPEGHGGDLMRSMALEMAEIGSRVILFTALEVPSHSNLLSILLEPGEPELFPLACAVPQELLLDRMASDRGWTAGVFRRGSKITARE